MPKSFFHRWHGLHIIWIFAVMALMIMVLMIYSWILGTISFILAGVLMYYTLLSEKAFRKDMHDYVLGLSHRIKNAGDEVINSLPIGIVLYNEDGEVQWHNPFVSDVVGKKSLIGDNLYEHFPNLRGTKKQESVIDHIVGDQHYRIMLKAEERLIYLFDITEHATLAKKYEEEKLTLGVVMLDNMEEVTQGMDDQTRSILQAKVIGKLNEWGHQHGIYMRRITADKFMLILDQKTLDRLEDTRFAILDEVRDLTSEFKLPMTLSIGIAAGGDSFVELGKLAQSSLDMALGRGGDQVVVRRNDSMQFYGGRSNAVEKRTRVRVRVIAHAMRDLIKDSDKVLIMGHRMPDMDAIGAAIGVLKAVQFMYKEGYIVLEDENPGIFRLMEEVRKHENLHKWFITPEQAEQIMTSRSLVVMVDTHRPSMAADPKLLSMTNRIVLIDHHRRGEDFIRDATMVYMEPYASSTCELVTELLQYMHERLSIDVLEATALLAGIVVDTKSFTYRTGARTFEAASFLRRHGADTAMVQCLLKEDIEAFVQKAEVIRNAEIYFDKIAIATSVPGQKYSQFLIAQAADALLGMSGVTASFVICERADDSVGISARSLGELNVQVVMEQLGGGGHLTNAAAQLNMSLDEAKQQLIALLNQMDEEERLFE